MTAPVHEPGRSRFVVPLAPGGEAVLEYARSAGAVDFHHTFVPASARGQGIAELLVRAGLDWARAEGLHVRASCSYVAAYLRRHPARSGAQEHPA